MENLFEYFIETDNLHLKYAKGEPAVKEQEFHDYNEFVFFVNGKSYLYSKNIQQELICGSIVLIPKEHFHQFCVSLPESYVRCILGFRETPETQSLVSEVMNTIKIITKPHEKVKAVFENLIEIVKSELSYKEKQLFIQSSLTQLLIYLKQYSSEEISKSVKLSASVNLALHHIDKSYAENISVESIAKLLYISPSTLSHKFKKELNISVYQYITKKRLSVAHELIRKGESLTNAALSCGFNDYSCF